jgi:hypothetical protein
MLYLIRENSESYNISIAVTYDINPAHIASCTQDLTRSSYTHYNYKEVME